MANETPTESKAKYETFTTNDNATIAALHIRNDGPPVILIHGLGVNGYAWNFDDLQTEEFSYRSVAATLHDAGYDVWIPNLRGYGRDEWQSKPATDQAEWCVDHHIHFDIPAIIDGVIDATKRKPLVIAQSMGAISTACYLSGARLECEKDGTPIRVFADEKTARARQEKIAGCILLEFPAALRWPSGLYDDTERFQWDSLFQRNIAKADRNYPFEVLSRAAWLQVMVQRMGNVRLDWLQPSPQWVQWRDNSQPALRDLMIKCEATFAEAVTMIGRRVNGNKNINAEMFMHGFRYSVDHLHAGVLKQFAKSVRARSLVSALGTTDHDYPSGYPHIELPILLLLGAEDNIANADVCREVFYDRIASTDKTIHIYDNYSHGGIQATPSATELIYPTLLDWVKEHSPPSE